MTKNAKHCPPLLAIPVFYVFSLLILGLAGLLFKALFVFYNREALVALDAPQIIHALLWGARFDLAAAAFFALPATLAMLFHAPRAAARLLPWMLAVQMLLQTGDAIYFAEAGRHVSYEMRDALADASGLLLTALGNHGGFLLLSGVVLLAVGWLVKKITPVFFCPPAKPFGRAGQAVALLAVLFCTLVLVRGGVSGLPQSVLTAFKIGDPQQAVVSMNGAYSVVYGAIHSKRALRPLPVNLPRDVDMKAVLERLYPRWRESLRGLEAARPAQRYNLVFILMEGWPADFMSAYGYPSDTTPFFRQLKARSLAPLGAIAGGLRTTEGIYATFCSQQNPLGKSVARSSLQNNPYRCLPQILKEKGWHTAFFQGSHKETSGTGAFAQSLGFTESFAREDMVSPRYPFNAWGAQDPDVYDLLLERLDRMPQPFLVGVNTNTTHDIQLPPGVTPVFGMDSDLHRHESVLRFADDAMRDFFAKIRQKPYFDNTVFVLMSDHTHDRHKSVAAKYFIPALIYAPGIVKPRLLPRYISQRDMAPTVLAMLGLPPSPSFAGKALWQNDDGVHFADYYDNGTLGWLRDDRLVETPLGEGALRCYSLQKGLLEAQAAACRAY